MNVRSVLLAICLWCSAVEVGVAAEVGWSMPSLRPICFDLFGYAVPALVGLSCGIGVCLTVAAWGIRRAFRCSYLVSFASRDRTDLEPPRTDRDSLLQLGRVMALPLLQAVGGFSLLAWAVGHSSALTSGLFGLFVLLGVVGSGAAAWVGGRVGMCHPPQVGPVDLRAGSAGESPSSYASRAGLALALSAIELLCILAVLLFVPPSRVVWLLLAFLLGQSLGSFAFQTCARRLGDSILGVSSRASLRMEKGTVATAYPFWATAEVGIVIATEAFCTFGIAGVGLLLLLVLALESRPALCGLLVAWLFVQRLTVLLVSWAACALLERSIGPLSSAVSKRWILGVSVFATLLSFAASYVLLGASQSFPSLWWVLALLVSCGMLAVAWMPGAPGLIWGRSMRRDGIGSWSGGVGAGCLLAVCATVGFLAARNGSYVKALGGHPGLSPLIVLGLMTFGAMGWMPLTKALSTLGSTVVPRDGVGAGSACARVGFPVGLLLGAIALIFAGLRVARGSSEAFSIGSCLSQPGFYLGLFIGWWALHWSSKVSQVWRVRQAKAEEVEVEKGGQSLISVETTRHAAIHLLTVLVFLGGALGLLSPLVSLGCCASVFLLLSFGWFPWAVPAGPALQLLVLCGFLGTSVSVLAARSPASQLTAIGLLVASIASIYRFFYRAGPGT